jgi:hypothetical protein
VCTLIDRGGRSRSKHSRDSWHSFDQTMVHSCGDLGSSCCWGSSARTCVFVSLWASVGPQLALCWWSVIAAKLSDYSDPLGRGCLGYRLKCMAPEDRNGCFMSLGVKIACFEAQFAAVPPWETSKVTASCIKSGSSSLCVQLVDCWCKDGSCRLRLRGTRQLYVRTGSWDCLLVFPGSRQL